MALTDIDYGKLLRWLTPFRLRLLAMGAWLRSLTAPVSDTLYPAFKAGEAADWYRLRHTGSLTHLQGVLNDAFDPADRHIYIDDGDTDVEVVYVYTEPELLPLPLYTIGEDDPVYLYSLDEIEAAIGYFVVYVPDYVSIIGDDLAQFRSLLDSYKAAGTHYTITIYNYY